MEQVQLYNTLTRRKEIFEPIEPGQVKMYNCGPTVYDRAHIGNMRTYIMADIIRRTFEYLGYNVTQVMNITDVGHLTSDQDEGEDRMLVGAQRAGKDPWEVAERFTNLFFDDATSLNILRPHIVCKATDHITDMITFVKKLQVKGYAYEIDDGVYLDVERLPNYGQHLSKQSLTEMQAGARVCINSQKHHPADFALWRKAAPEHIMQWDSPWGRGYPGWHIECSVMSMKYLGDIFDIHTGGEDHIAVHHENEIAQSEAATGNLFANYWLHGRFLRRVDEAKMSKSTGGFLVMDDLVDRGFDPLTYRYYCLTASYRVPLTFSWEGLQQAADSLNRLRQTVQRLAEETQNMTEITNTEKSKQLFCQTIVNDFDMPGALALTWEAVRQANRTDNIVDKHTLLHLLLDFDKVLGLKLQQMMSGKEEDLPAEISTLLERREIARLTRDWSLADSLRETIQAKGFQVEDTPTGPKLRRIR